MARDTRDTSPAGSSAPDGSARLPRWRDYSPVASRPLMRALRDTLLVLGLVLAALSVYQFIRVASTFDTNDDASDSASVTLPEASVHHDVLLLMSYDDGHVTAPYIREGVLDGFAGYNVTCEIEYLHTKDYPLGTPASDATIDALAVRIAAHDPYDVVIVADDDALRVVEAHRDLFRYAPTVFLGINDHDHGIALHAKGWATGVLEFTCYDEMLDLIGQVRPASTNIAVIVDETTTGVGDLAQLQIVEANHPEFSFEILNAGQLSFEQIRERLRELGDESVAVQLDAFADVEGNLMSVSEAARYFSADCPVPLFRGNMGGVGDGICLAAYSDFHEAGMRASEMALHVIAGTSPADIELDMDNSLGVMADSRELERFGIPESALPAHTILVNDMGYEGRRLITPIATPLALLIGSLLAFLGFAFIGYRLSYSDAQELTRSRDQLEFEVAHDHLTGLPNRNALDGYLAGTDDAPSPARAAIEVDLDDFADINDTYGSATGDHVIRELAGRLAEVPCALLSRAGGDEFVLVFDHVLETDAAEMLQVMSVFAQPVEAGDAQIAIGGSIGVVLEVPEGQSGDLMRRADLAVREAKAVNGKHELRFYEERLSEDYARSELITIMIRRALDEDGVIALYQPQVDSVTKEVYGFEALCRIHDCPFGPGEFISIAEKSGMIVELGRRMAELVVTQQATWLAAGLPPRVVSVNFSPGQLLDVGYVDFLRMQLELHQVPASLIKIEVTESMMLEDSERAETMVGELKAMGINIALDDFGTGYSSFDRLTYDAIDFVKFDKSFTDSFLTPENETVVDNMARLMHDLGKRVVMEGVETREQLDACIRLGCDYIQGYYFSRPIPADDVPGFSPRA